MQHSDERQLLDISNKELTECSEKLLSDFNNVQSYGFIVVTSKDYVILQVSENILERIQPTSDLKLFWTSYQDLIGQNIQELTQWSEEQLHSISSHLKTISINQVELLTDGRISSARWECQAHISRTHYVFEFLPRQLSVNSIYNTSQINQLAEVLNYVRRSSSVEVLYQQIVHSIQRASGYERVMIYMFDKDWCGEVVAESCAKHIEPRYIGLRFPANDIPKRARELYKINPLRLLYDLDSAPVKLFPELLPGSVALDQSRCLLRNMADTHLKYLKNMGVKSSMTLSLLNRGELWGMIACHHSTPRWISQRLTAELRTSCELIAEVFVSELNHLEAQDLLFKKSEIAERIKVFERFLYTNGVSKSSLSGALKSLIKDSSYSCIGVRIGEHSLFIGDNGDEIEVQPNFFKQIINAEPEHTDLQICMINNLKLIPNELKESSKLFRDTCGLMWLPVKNITGAVLVLGKPEMIQTVTWGGRPAVTVKKTSVDSNIIEPRTSFAAWKEEKRGNCEEWHTIDTYFANEISTVLEEIWLLSENRKQQQELHFLAHYDTLTGLGNRHSCRLFINDLKRDSLLSYFNVGAFLIDLDNFNQVNDLLGHQVGDKLIISFANLLRNLAHGKDEIFRLSGDEFLLVKFYPKTEEQINQEELNNTSQAIQQALFNLTSNDTRFRRITCCMGVTSLSHHNTDPSRILKQADIALNFSKKRGPNTFHIYSVEDEHSLKEFSEIQMLIEHALANDEFELHIQPKLDNKKQLVSAEALIRWPNSKKGSLMPDQFIPVAERSGQIVEIGSWVLKKACSILARWQQLYPFKPISLAINCSPSQIVHPEFVISVASQLETYNINPDRLILEVTENVLAEDPKRVILAMRALKNLGVAFSLDDFGTGYSSFKYLKDFPVSELKIDRYFVLEASKQSKTKQILGSMIAMGKSLALKIVAEGVETAEQLELLQSFNCDIYQGFYFEKPMKVEAFECKWMAVQAR
ncbi:MAG: EAL domain-containing protein [Gammaproteobacteria bacterium]|nr:EAL domain-containing protein [Gammaproteobacteria bacterium]